jgi:tRNA U55 pseudouridine synthase TruB
MYWFYLNQKEFADLIAFDNKCTSGTRKNYRAGMVRLMDSLYKEFKKLLRQQTEF